MKSIILIFTLFAAAVFLGACGTENKSDAVVNANRAGATSPTINANAPPTAGNFGNTAQNINSARDDRSNFNRRGDEIGERENREETKDYDERNRKEDRSNRYKEDDRRNRNGNRSINSNSPRLEKEDERRKNEDRRENESDGDGE